MNILTRHFLAGAAACAAGWVGGPRVWRQEAPASSGIPGNAPAHAAAGTVETPLSAGPPPPDSPLNTLREVLAKAETATFEEACAMLQDSRRYTDTYRRRSTRDALLQRLMDIDPARTMEFVQTYDEGRIKGIALDILTRCRPEEAMRYARSSRDLWSQFSAYLAKSHPERYLDLLAPEEGPAVFRNNKSLNDAFTTLGMKDPGTALARLDRLPEDLRGQGLLRILKQWAIQDAGAALQWTVASVPPERTEMALAGVIYGTLSEETAMAAWKLLKDKGLSASVHSDVPKTIAVFMAKRDPREALNFLCENLPAGPAAETAFETVLPALGEDSARTVTELTARLLAMGKRAPLSADNGGEAANTADLIRESLEKWRPADTRAMLESLPPEGGPPETALVRDYLARRRAREDPDAAVAWAQKAGSETRRIVAEQAMELFINRGDAAQCVAAAALLEPGPAGELLFQAGKDLAQDHPRKAVIAAEAITDERGRAACLDNISRAWARRDPDAALEWALTRGGKERASCLSSAVQSWASYDAWSASAWLTGQPPGPVRDYCINGLVGSLAQSEPSSAFEWSKSASTPGNRENFMLWTAVRWARTDPVAAMQAVNAEETLSPRGVENFYNNLKENGIIP